MEKDCALIRANFNIDPEECDYETWASLYGQALWLEKWRLKNLNEMMAKMFSSEKNDLSPRRKTVMSFVFSFCYLTKMLMQSVSAQETIGVRCLIYENTTNRKG